MPIPDGLYKIAFSGPEGTEYGVANLHAGKWRGGDSGMAHVGTYGQEGDWLRAELCVTQHRHVPGVVSALGYNDLTVQLEGPADGYSAEVRGRSRDVPGVRFTAKLTYLAD